MNISVTFAQTRRMARGALSRRATSPWATRALTILTILTSLGCASAFPPGALDYGRGATPLPQGTTRVQVGGGGGAAPFTLTVGAGVGARVEHQLLDDLSLSADAGAGAQTVAGLGVTIPLAGYAGAQWNPFGIEWLALRFRAGGGLDTPLPVELGALADPNSDAGNGLDIFFPAPYAAAVGQLVFSMDFADGVEAYVAPGFGVKQFFGERAVYARTVVKLDGPGYVDTMLTPGVTAGIDAAMTDNLSFYASGTVTPAILLGVEGIDASGKGPPLVAVSPSGGLQTGLALTF